MSHYRSPHGTPIIGIAGWKNSGKTTLAVRLIAEFVARGMRVASVKHAHHAFQLDDGATDSARHRQAGAAQVAIVSRQRLAVLTELHGLPEPPFDEVIAMLAPADLIIVEGYKRAPIAKIEVRRAGSASGGSLAPADPDIIAIATDTPDAHASALPVFYLDDIAALADFLTHALSLRRKHDV